MIALCCQPFALSDDFYGLGNSDGAFLSADSVLDSSELPIPPFQLLTSSAMEEPEPTEPKTVSLEEHEKLLERVEEIESSWEKYQDKLKDDAEAKKKKSSFKLNGRVHLDNWNFLDSDAGTNFLETGDPTDDPEDRFDFRRIRLTWTGEVPDHMLFRIMIDFNNPNRPEMKDTYLGFKNLPYNQQLLIGNQKRPIGLDHLNSSRHNVFIERPLAVETFNEDARRLGVCMYGHNNSESINWRYGAFLLENITNDGRYRGDSTEGGLYGRLAGSPWYDEISGGRGYYHWAIVGSVNQTDPDGTLDADDNANEGRFRTRPLARSDSRWWNTGRIPGSETYQQLGFESMLNIGAFQLTGEYFNTWLQRDALGGFNGDDLHFHGGYLFASYFLTGEHIPLKRTAGVIDRVKPFENFFVVDRCRGGTGRGWGALAIALRADYLDLSDSDIRGGDGYAITAGLNWYWTAYSKLQTNYIFGEIENAGQNEFGGPTLAGVDGDFNILGFRYMIDF
ncbi:MAG: porin [Planctomycetota bacterium]